MQSAIVIFLLPASATCCFQIHSISQVPFFFKVNFLSKHIPKTFFKMSNPPPPKKGVLVYFQKTVFVSTVGGEKFEMSYKHRFNTSTYMLGYPLRIVFQKWCYANSTELRIYVAIFIKMISQLWVAKHYY
jgi:hypothetical protein